MLECDEVRISLLDDMGKGLYIYFFYHLYLFHETPTQDAAASTLILLLRTGPDFTGSVE